MAGTRPQGSLSGGRPLGVNDTFQRKPKLQGMAGQIGASPKPTGSTAQWGGMLSAQRGGLPQQNVGAGAGRGVMNAPSMSNAQTNAQKNYAMRSAGKSDVQQQAIRKRMMGRLADRGIISKGAGSEGRQGYLGGTSQKQATGTGPLPQMGGGGVAKTQEIRPGDPRLGKQVPGGPRKAQKPLGFGGY